ncbi:MAG: hypothetical protein ACOY3K_00335 [Candidatus Omnitrophota bacterium]
MKSSFIFNFERTGKYRLRPGPVIVFGLIGLAIFVSLEIANRRFVEKKSFNFSSIRKWEKVKDRIELLFLGDSHFIASVGVYSAMTDTRAGVYDLSMPGNNYVQSYYLLKKHLAEMPRLKAVVLPLDLHSFSAFRSERFIFKYFWDRYMDYKEYRALGGRKIRTSFFALTLLEEETRQFRFPGEGVLGREDMLKRSRWKKDPGEKYLRAKHPRTPAQRRAEFHFKKETLFDPVMMRYFLKTLQMLKERGLIALTLQMPVTRAYAEAAAVYVTPETLRQKVLETPEVAGLVTQAYDYFDAFFDRDDMFKDPDHLSLSGSAIFADDFFSRLARDHGLEFPSA